jgi:hypothetical protein
LPIKRLTRATRKGQSKLAAEQGNFAGEFISSHSEAAKVPIGRALPEKGADRTVTILTTG